MRKYFSVLIFIIFSLISFTSRGYAACTTPNGQESQTRYDFAVHKMYYCDNSDWLELGASGSGGGGEAVPKFIDQIASLGITINPVTIAATDNTWPDYIICDAAGGKGFVILIQYTPTLVIYQNPSGNRYIFPPDGSSVTANGCAASSGIDAICNQGRCGFFSTGLVN